MVYGLNGIYSSNRVNWNKEYSTMQESYSSTDVELLSEELYTGIIYNDSLMIENTISMYYDQPQLLTESVMDVVNKVVETIKRLLKQAKDFVIKYINKFKDWLKERKSKKSSAISPQYGTTGQDKDGRKWTMRYVYTTKDGSQKVYEEDGYFDVLAGQKLSTPIIIWKGINNINDFSDVFDKLMDRIKETDKKLKEIMLKFERVDFGNVDIVTATDTLNNCIDSMDNLMQETKDMIDEEEEKLSYGSLTESVTDPTKDQLKAISDIIHINKVFEISLNDGDENKYTKQIELSYDVVNNELNKYLDNLNPYVKGKANPFNASDDGMNKGKLDRYYNNYVSKVTSMVNYLSSKLSSIYANRVSNVSRYARDMVNNGEILEREKIKFLSEHNALKLTKSYAN